MFMPLYRRPLSAAARIGNRLTFFDLKDIQSVLRCELPANPGDAPQRRKMLLRPVGRPEHQPVDTVLSHENFV